MIFRNKAFNISFLISVFWHLFWISIVTIITVPTGLSVAKYSKVSFLGPILEKTAFELMLEESPIRVEALYRQPIIPQYTFEVKIESPRRGSPKLALEVDKPFISKFSLRDIIREDKMTIPTFFKGVSSVSSKETGFKSPLENREVISKPHEIPKVPMWITKDKESFKIELEFTVSPSGLVERVSPVVSSGNPNVDMIGMDYLKKWRFTPLKSSGEQKNQVGRVGIELKAD